MMEYLLLFLAAQFALLGVVVWLVRRWLRKTLAAILAAPAANDRVTRGRALRRLLTEARQTLADHSHSLGAFEESLTRAAAETPGENGRALDDRLRDVQRSNRQADQTLEAISAGLAAAGGDWPTDAVPDLKPYQTKIAALDHALEHLDDETTLADVASQLVDLVRDLRRDNVSLREEVVAAKEQVIEYMSRAHTAEQVARVDALTQLPNRRAFEEVRGQLQATLERHGEPYCLALFDLDHFKRVNDQFGHAAGDAVLAMVARIFRESQRTSDHVCRLGGEEFALLLPKCDERSGKFVAERYRRKIEAAVLRYADRELRVTISGGVTSAVRDEPLRRLLERADAALYAAKSRGRNRIRASSETEQEHVSEAGRETVREHSPTA